MRSLSLLLFFSLFSGVNSYSQEESKTAALRFMQHFSSKNLDSAKFYCSGFARNNYFNNKKQIKYFMYEYFKDPSDLVIAEAKENEVRVGFNSGEAREYREVFLKKNGNGDWKIVSKAELLLIKEYFLEIFPADSTKPSSFLGWNTMDIDETEMPKRMHLLRDEERLKMFAMDFPVMELRDIIENHKTDYPEVDVVLVDGNVFPLFLLPKEKGTATIESVKRAVEDTYATNLIVQGSFILGSGISGRFRMKVNADYH